MCIGEHFDAETDMKYSETSQDDDEGSNSSQTSDDSKDQPLEFGIQEPLNGNMKYDTKYDNPSSVSMCIGEHFDAETDMKYSETSQDDDEGSNSSQTSDDSKDQPPEFGIQEPLNGNMKYDTKYDNPSSVSMCIGEHFDIEIDMKYSEMSQDDDEGSNSSQTSDDSKDQPPEFGIQEPLNGQESEGQNSLHKQNPVKEKKNEQDDISCGTKVCGSNLCNKNMDAGIGRTEMKCLNPPQDDDSCSSNSNDFLYSDCPKKIPLNGQYPDADPESQNFLSDHNPSKKKYEAEYHQGTASFGMSVFNLGNAIMGSGILGLSFAMANTGIALFVILLVIFAIFSLYSVHLLLKTADGAGARVYESLGYQAFGIPGKLAVSCSITMQNIGATSSYLYIIKYELPIVIQSFTGANDGEWYINGDYLVILVSIIILPLTLLRNLGYLGYTSGLSLLCMVFFVIVVIIKKFQSPCPLPVPDSGNETIQMFNITPHSDNITTDDDTCKPKYFVFNSQTVYAIPILTFAFVCHPTILSMYEELKDRSRRKMQNVANVSFLAMFIMYLLAALFGYLTFNIHVGPELLHTYSNYYKYDILLLVVRLAVLAAVTLTVPVMLFPIRTSVGHLLFPGKDFSWIRHSIITLILLAGTNILVIFVPSIRDIFGFIGASAAAMLIFILPSAFYLKLVKKESFTSMQKIGAMMFLILGFVVMFGCMTLIIYDWIISMKDQDH